MNFLNEFKIIKYYKIYCKLPILVIKIRNKKSGLYIIGTRSVAFQI